jgi:uncharacterized membrane-anchored protein
MDKISEKINAFLQDTQLLIVVAFILLAGTVRTIISETKRNFGDFIKTNVIAGFVGGLTLLVIYDYESFGIGIKGGVSTMAGLVGAEILKGVIKIAQNFAENPLTFIRDIRNGTKKED